jgi:fatty acid desaturase
MRTISHGRSIGPQVKSKGDVEMLWTIFVILLVLWLVGLVSFHAIGWYIHILLVLALVVLLIQLISGRRPVV